MENNSSTTSATETWTPTETTNTETNRLAGLKQHQLNEGEQQAVINLAFDVLKARHKPGEPLTCPQQTRNFLRLLLADRKVEIFGCLFLDNRHRIIDTVELFQGTIDGASVYPRVVVQQALVANAAAILFFHNHPSGVAEPSQADERITQRLKKALELIDIRVLDHLVVSAGDSVSFAERGLL
jgi:DNA repair protein RadC